MSTNVRKFRFPCIFDSCDVVYNWSISLLPRIVFDNLFCIKILKRVFIKKQMHDKNTVLPTKEGTLWTT